MTLYFWVLLWNNVRLALDRSKGWIKSVKFCEINHLKMCLCTFAQQNISEYPGCITWRTDPHWARITHTELKWSPLTPKDLHWAPIISTESHWALLTLTKPQWDQRDIILYLWWEPLNPISPTKPHWASMTPNWAPMTPTESHWAPNDLQWAH